MTANAFEEGQPQQERPQYVEWVAPYGLSDIKFVECRNAETGSLERCKVTDNHRYAALDVTRSETLDFFDSGVQCVSPGLRRYGGTLAAIVRRFQEERSVIDDEMGRIARRNLECIVKGKLAGRRILNLKMAIAVKEERDGIAQVEEPPVEEARNSTAPVEEPPVGSDDIPDPDFLR